MFRFNAFQDAEHETYQNIHAYMMLHPELLTSDNEQGLEMAKTDNYAFFMESSTIEYLVERNCEVIILDSIVLVDKFTIPCFIYKLGHPNRRLIGR